MHLVVVIFFVLFSNHSEMQKTLMFSSNSAKNSSGRGLSVTGDTTLDWVDCFSDMDDDNDDQRALALRRAEV